MKIRWADLTATDAAGVPTERNFVLDAWLNNFIDANEAGPLPMSRARRAYEEAIKAWLAGFEGIEVRVAESRTFGELIGFVVTYTTPRHGRMLMFVYVKAKFRTKVKTRAGEAAQIKVKRGIASMLLEAAGFKPNEPYGMCFRNDEWRRLMGTSRRWRAGVLNPKPAKFSTSNHVVKEDR